MYNNLLHWYRGSFSFLKMCQLKMCQLIFGSIMGHINQRAVTTTVKIWCHNQWAQPTMLEQVVFTSRWWSTTPRRCKSLAHLNQRVQHTVESISMQHTIHSIRAQSSPTFKDQGSTGGCSPLGSQFSRAWELLGEPIPFKGSAGPLLGCPAGWT